MASFRLIASTPVAQPDPAIAIAATRAGELGVVDLTEAFEAGPGIAAIARMAALARGSSGVRLDAGLQDVAPAVAQALPERVRTAIVRPAGAGDTAALAEILTRRGVAVLVEITDVTQLGLVADLPLSGVVAKGSEAGGWVGEETAMVLLQRVISATELPVYVHGGIDPHTAAACAQAGAAGVVLDGQLLLVRESPLPESTRAALARFDGTETAVVGAELGAAMRVYAPAHAPAATELRETAESLTGDGAAAAWRLAVRKRLGWGPGAVWPTGQDVAFAAALAERHLTTGRVLGAVRAALDEDLATAYRLRPLAPGAPLAKAHGTRYPIVQGPMTRVSDSPAFAEAVATGGALPVIALALMRGAEVTELLRETRERLGDRPWGAGILGFVEQELRQEQIDAIRACPPDFAVIAGGRPDQALALEEDEIATYLHVPSPALLELFVRDGARRFVWEGRECGGHVGPRSSFVLWSLMAETLLRTVPEAELPSCQVLFAGGVHDALSSAMVATLAAPLVRHGVRVGVLLGTAYLFTEEIVTSGAVVPGFQARALECTGTALIVSGPGHAIRCARSPFVDTFNERRARLRAEGLAGNEIRGDLEQLSLGRLRVASKGLARASDPRGARLMSVPADAQRRQGMYMLGQVAALRTETRTVADLHEDVSTRGSERLVAKRDPVVTSSPAARAFDAAIVGMGCLLPGAPSIDAYWRNILGRVDAVGEVPPDRFPVDRYFDPDPAAPDRIYSRWGGFLEEIEFDPLRWGLPPSSMPSIEPLQILVLETVRQALTDAGYLDRPFAREHTSVILGLGGGVADLGHRYAVRSGLTELFEDVPAEALNRLPDWTEDSFPGILLNVVAGRVANRFDLGGVNFAVDAACASSLTAVQLACRELEAGTSEMVVAGGGDTVQNAFGYTCFSKTHALSPTGRCRTFDATADGIAISEGVAVVVLKRLSDAERDGDRVYAVVKAVAGSSDGRDRGLTAPRPEGQALALRRAYAQAGVSPARAGLVEAHGTGTVAGDRAEVQTLRAVFEESGAAPRACALGSVKSMIGHTKCTAGVAGLAKAALALRHKVLPPTLHVERPNPEARFGESPFHVNTELRPWISADSRPRIAGVSAFGFGGTNFHAVLEEYSGGYDPVDEAPLAEWPADLMLWAGDSRGELLAALAPLERALDLGAEPRLGDLARTCAAGWAGGSLRLAIVATSLQDLREKLGAARTALEAGDRVVDDPRGIHFAEEPLAPDGHLALLFPGQGSQECGMLRELAVHFGEVRECFELLDRVLGERVSRHVFPPPAFEPGERAEQEAALRATDVAQPALGAAGLGMARLLARLGVEPDAVAGHSYGEYVALAAAGAIVEEDLIRLSRARGRAIVEASEGDLGTMAAVMAAPERVEPLIADTATVIANRNGPRQTVISGSRESIEAASERLAAAGLEARQLPVACAFHSPVVAPARDRLAEVLAAGTFAVPRLPVYANALAAPYPNDPDAVARVLTDHLVKPVRWAEQIEAMYDDGVRIFIESGPRTVLTGLVRQILGDRPHLCVAPDAAPGGLVGLQHALARLAAHGVPVDLGGLHRGRGLQALALDELRPAPGPGPTAWLVSGGRARQAHPAPGPAPVPSSNGSRRNVMTPVPDEPPVADAGAVSPDLRGEALVAHQRVMQRFLETQEAVMLAFLGGANPPPAVSEPRPGPALPLPVAEPAESATSPATAVQHAPEDGRVLDDPESVQAALMEIVSARTGYPPDMLDLDVDVEAELGLDSIKVFEIVGAFQAATLPPDLQLGAEAMEHVAGQKTLRSVLETVTELAVRPEDGSPAANGAPAGNGAPPRETGTLAPVVTPAGEAGAERDEVPRFVPREEELPPLEEPVALEPTGAFLVTDDSGQVAPRLGAALAERGIEAVRLQPADTVDAAAAVALVEEARREHGRVAGIVHLSALRPSPAFEELDLEGWLLRLREDVQALAVLLRAAANDLRDGGRVLAASALGGTFALDPERRDFPPLGGGIPALLKTVALEWPRAHVKAVDLDPELEAETCVELLLRELAAGDGEPEVAHAGGRRTAPRVRREPVADSSPALEPDAVVLLTGGARGITAELACQLAHSYAPTLLLAGRSPLPGDEEPAVTAALTDPRALRAALVEQRRRAGLAAATAEVERSYRELMAAREIRRTLARLRAAGSTVHYEQLDVRDPEALAGLVDRAYAEHGRIDGVIHGAGVIEDRRIEDKDAASFERVVATKTTSAFVLARHLRSEGLAFAVFLTSVAARFGNPGQADYAAANGILQKLATYLDRRWPARVVAVDWAPWAEVGMAAGGVADRLAARGLPALAPAAGRRALDLELRGGAESEVVLGDGPWATAAPAPVAL